ncbi:DUF4287 domain-containing protein [Paucibacter sp. O1-1]|uniref:DUF4287 domain-containing protein n=1 Tax=Paucibacter sp. M5-1 TaxID=3015998 RepID=UPI0010F55964|nr:DUF4287 domain-containing protein [Paucibacter sp. M5-1]MCU7371876.1 DUF4287 domain-containing protein [Paucibacter sp. O1-1]MCZ7880914.1 DUF4287 domain-containing protein [Paucibacter sp. M5-1]MDA3826866.1 DUF4287 domain-containing protein [Paucibacter sp. O1-1]
MSTNDKPQGGPATYFPSIEKKYGQPIAHWLSLAEGLKGMKHMEMVAWFKTEHGLGHGHANAIVAYQLARK